MPKYFNYFPKTVYSNGINPTSVDVVTNIMSKFAFESTFKNNTVVFYEYVISDGETPESIAHKIYGDSEKHWIILTLNDIYNPQTEWQLEQRTFIRYINKKYYDQANAENKTGVEWAQTNNYAYYKIETQTLINTGQQTVKYSEIDSYEYANTITEIKTVTLPGNQPVKFETQRDVKTYYDYEFVMNEMKRGIKILKPEFVGPVEDEMRRLFETKYNV
jgi:hypothetical protein